MPDDQPRLRRRTTEWSDPKAAAEAGRGLSGLDYMTAMMAGSIPRPPISLTLGFEVAEVAEGSAVFTCTPGEHHYNPIGMVHGGLVSTLIDSATGCAVHTTLPVGVVYSTVNLSVDMLRPVTDRTGPLRCEGKVVHRGSRIAIAAGEVVGERDGKVYARGQSTCLISEIGGRPKGRN